MLKKLKVGAVVFSTCVIAELSLAGMAYNRVDPIVGALTYALILVGGTLVAVHWDIKR